jgi:hypothetical protein
MWRRLGRWLGLSESERPTPAESWWSGEAVCDVCTHRFAAVVELADREGSVPRGVLQCPSCGQFAAHPAGTLELDP